MNSGIVTHMEIPTWAQTFCTWVQHNMWTVQKSWSISWKCYWVSFSPPAQTERDSGFFFCSTGNASHHTHIIKSQGLYNYNVTAVKHLGHDDKGLLPPGHVPPWHALFWSNRSTRVGGWCASRFRGSGRCTSKYVAVPALLLLQTLWPLWIPCKAPTLSICERAVTFSLDLLFCIHLRVNESYLKATGLTRVLLCARSHIVHVRIMHSVQHWNTVQNSFPFVCTLLIFKLNILFYQCWRSYKWKGAIFSSTQETDSC